MVLQQSNRRMNCLKAAEPWALQEGECPGSHGLSLNSLVKIGEEIDSERVLLVKLVAVGIFHGIQSMGRRRILQENVPEARKTLRIGRSRSVHTNS